VKRDVQLRVVVHPPDSRNFIQRLFGQGLLGTPDKNKLVIMCGSGANGKSTLTDTMVELLGSYALATSANTEYSGAS